MFDTSIDELHIHLHEETTPLEKELLFQGVYEYRGDASAYVIRSSKNRAKYHTYSLPAHAVTRDIHKGDILILNEAYGQYKAELQIALCDRLADSKINVVGHIVEDEMILLDAMCPFQKFQLKEEIKK